MGLFQPPPGDLCGGSEVHGLRAPASAGPGDLDGERGGGLNPFVHMMVVMLFEVLFGLIGSMVTARFSRYREFRADVGGARFAGRGQMIAALKRLQAETAPHPEMMGAVNQLQISSGRKKSSFISLFASHPALEDRIEALEKGIQ